MTGVVTLDIEAIAAGGDGIARHDGLVVFVPRTAPGDRVRARVEQRGRMARGVLERVERAAPGRVTPACPHYETDQCGGCQLQHLAADAQHAAKRRIVADAFRRIGRREVPLPDLHAGLHAWRYRRKLTLALRCEHGRWIAGYHVLGNPARIFSLDDCHIADERLVRVWRDIMGAAALLPDAGRLRGSVRLVAGSDGEASFTLEGATRWTTNEEFFGRVPALASLWWTPTGGARQRLQERRRGVAAGAPDASFAQVNPEVAARLEGFVTAAVMEHHPATVVDGYAGTGDGAARLAALGVHVTAIELDADASALCASRLPPGSRALHARVEDALPSALPADVVILNPPRAGVDARVTARLANEARLRAIIYVSCDPATLARDVARLPAWRVSRLTAFDMFPQTAHVETVCELVPEAAP